MLYLDLPSDHKLTCDKNRIPDPTAVLSICLVSILVRWPRSLYVLPWKVHRFEDMLIYPVVYIFTGSILVDNHLMLKIFGSLVGIIGIAYVVLEFVPSIEPPQNMREADGGWGAEQV